MTPNRNKTHVQKRDVKHIVLLLENIHPNAVAAFRDAGYTVRHETKALDEAELVDAVRGVSILGIRSKTQVTKKVLEAADSLVAVGAFCIGTNQIDLAAATERGIAVFNAPYSNTRSVVELVVGEMIMLLRRTFDASATVHAGGWAKSASDCFEIRGKKLGIVGYGNIGTQLSVLAEALGMHVAFYDIRERLALGNAKKMRHLDDLLAWADIVTLHVDGRKENENLLGKKQLAVMKKGAYLLNLSRGHVVDIDALAAALTKGHLRGAAVDVFPHEPKGNDEAFVSPLQGLPNVILTPHVGGSTEEAQENIGSFVSNKLLQYATTGDTTLSVSLPHVSPGEKNGYPTRIVHIHANVPGMLAHINDVLAKDGVNIAAQHLKTNDRVGLVVTDCGTKPSAATIAALAAIPNTIVSRVL